MTSSPTDHQLIKSLGCDQPALLQTAQALAEKHRLSIMPVELTQPQLLLTESGLSLNLPDVGKPLFIDFTGGKLAHRRRFGGGRGQPLAKAIGLKAGHNPTVIDATAGLGRDAFVLATLGCKIDLLEHQPILAALLEDALQRATADPSTAEITARMRLYATNSLSYLDRLSREDYPEVIYLDPMYPERDKNALVKKDMQILHQLVGADQNADELLLLALKRCDKRVVVKRPSKAPTLAGLKANYTLNSKNTRYDVYLSRV